MVINPLTDKECRAIVARASLGRLGCALENQPYIVQVYYAYEEDYIYIFSTLGKKIEWMRANPKVCVAVDDIENQSQWASVLVNGTYEELPEAQFATERAHARKLLDTRHRWWVNALAERRLDSRDDLIDPIFFRIHIDSMTGLGAMAEDEAGSKPPVA